MGVLSTQVIKQEQKAVGFCSSVTNFSQPLLSRLLGVIFLEINVKFFEVFIIGVSLLISIKSVASGSKDISEIISKDEFAKYKDVGDFIDSSPKVTIIVKSEPEDIAEYGSDVVKSITGSDCDRDGEMDSNVKCNAVYYKLWMKYER